jgi:hypothetical protein
MQSTTLEKDEKTYLITMRHSGDKWLLVEGNIELCEKRKTDIFVYRRGEFILSVLDDSANIHIKRFAQVTTNSE